MIEKVRLAALSGGHLVDDMYQGAVPALVALLVVERHYSYSAAAGLTLAATVLSSVVQPLFGLLTDRREHRWMVPAGIAVAGSGIGVSGLGDSYAVTWLAVAVSGLGVAAYHPQAACSARAASGGTARGMSWFALGGNLGFAVGPAATTAVLVATGTAGTPLLAVPALVTAALFAVDLRRRPADPTGRAVGGATGPDRWGPFLWLSAAVVARSVLFFGLSTFLALYLRDRFGAGPAAAGAGLTVLLVVGAAATILGGRLADRIGRVLTIRIGYLLAVPGLLGLATAPSAGWALTATVVLGLAVYLPFSVQTTLGQDYLPGRIGTASGVTLGLAVSAGGVFAPALGLLADHAGLQTALLTLVAVPLLALAVTTRLPEPSGPTTGSYV